MTTPRARVAIILGFGLNPDSWRRRFERGEVADETPYAYHLASQWFDLQWSSDAIESTFSRWCRMSIRHALGFDFMHVWRNRRVIQHADVVWTHTEREHLAVALLKTLAPRRYRAVSIAQSVWLWDLWPGLSKPRSTLFSWLLRRHAVEIVLSRVNRDVSRVAVPGRAVRRVPFGSRFALAASDESRDIQPPRVLVVGNDRHRDWDLLARVAAEVPEADFDVISLSQEVLGRSWPVNVHVRSGKQRDVLDAYASSTLAALPLKKNSHASGCTVAIEAISAGLPLVVSDAGGIDEYVAESDAVLVPVGDVQGFVRGIRTALNAGAPSRSGSALASSRGLGESDYVTRLVLLTGSLLNASILEVDPAVESFVSPPVPARSFPASTSEGASV